MLQIITGEDEHTASEGPYGRLLKTRKWLILTATIAVLLHYGLYDPASFKDLVKVISVPEWLLRSSVAGGLTYMIFQYGMLIFQLGSTYDLVLAERFEERREADLQAAKDRLENAGIYAEDIEREYKSRTIANQVITPTDLNLARERLKDAAKSYEEVIRSNPGNRAFFRASEGIIDAARILVPAIFATTWLAITLVDIARH